LTADGAMDNLTHSLFALTLAQTPLRRAGRGAALALVLASNAPDSDLVVALTSGSQAYLSAHRGSSHGPLGVAGLAIVVATLVYGGRRWRQRQQRGPSAFSAHSAKIGTVPLFATSESADASFASLVGLALIGTLAHVLMDLPTSYGTRSLSPFDQTWYTLDWIPIIDVYLWGLLGAGLVAVWVKPTLRTPIASIVLALMTANYGLRAGLHEAALRRATAGGHGPRAILNAWPDAPSPKLPSDYPCAADPCAVTTAALPTFGSPFRWLILHQFSNGYRVTQLDLLAIAEEPLGWAPHTADPIVERAREASAPAAFLAFSRFPLAYVERSETDTIVILTDLRFREAPVGQRSESGLFTVFIRVDPHGNVLEHRFGN